MTGSDKKKKSPIILFFAAFIAIVIVMFVANYRLTVVQKLVGPKAGVEKLSTYGEQLIAISRDNDVYTWDWNDLSSRPKVGSVNARKVAAVSSDRLVWVPFARDELVVSNLKGDRQLKRLPLEMGRRCKKLEVSPNGKYAVTALVIDSDSGRRIQLAVIDSDLTSISPVETKTMEDGLKLNDVGVSNDGAFVAAVGGKDGGWILVAGANNEPILWEHYISDSAELNNVIFSPDGQMVYASESGRHVYVFESTTGKLVRRLEMDEYQTPPNNPQTISCISVSPDGRLMAAASAPLSQVWIWDAKSGAEVIVIDVGHFSTSGISFSPDLSLLAVADLTTSPIGIWRISENP